MKKYLFVPILCTCFIVACETQEIGYSNDVNTDAVYQCYKIDFSEGDSTAEVFAQFRFGGVNGTTLVLNNGSYVYLDGIGLKLDSSEFTGAFYSTKLSVTTINNRHAFTFHGNNGITYANAFTFKPVVLLNQYNPISVKNELVLNFAEKHDSMLLQISISDTSKETLDCDTAILVKNGKVSLPSNFISRLASGPIEIQISQKQIFPLKEITKEGGELDFTYDLKKITTKLVKEE